MDDPSTLRAKAARCFENAASLTADQAEQLNELGRQLEIWADDLEEILALRGGATSVSGMKQGPSDQDNL
jgi:hypothetical protein